MGSKLHHLASKFKLTEDFKRRFEKFLTSDLFHNQPEDAKSPPWKYQSKQIKYKIEDSILTLEGKSGYNIPDKKNSINSFVRLIKNFVKKILGLERSHNLSYKEAFNKVMNQERFDLFQRLNFKRDRIIAKNISECKKNFTFDYECYDHVIKSYYYINILNSYINLTNTKVIAEIGAGNGNLMSLLKLHFKTKCIINIDLPETLIMCIPYIENLFPEAKLLLPHEINEKIRDDLLLNYDFIFLTPSQIHLLENNSVDISINTAAFGEMNMLQIKNYLELIQKVGKNGSYFFCSDAVEKVAVGANRKNKDYLHHKPIRFFEYPFFDNEILFFELCKFTSLVQDNPCYLRLEKIRKQ